MKSIPAKILDDSYHIEEIEVDPSWASELGEDYREYRRRWEMASNFHLFDFPLFLEVESTYACNYRCPKCPRQAVGHEKRGGNLSTALFDKLFAEAARHRLPSITFSHGGEPLLRKDLAELFRKARSAGIIDRMIHTNGMLLSAERSAELIDSGITKINFSLDAASAETYDKVRPGGDYGRVVENIRLFLEARKNAGSNLPRVRVSFVVSEENRHEQQAFYDLWKDKANVICFQRCYDYTVANAKAPRADGNAVPVKPYKCSQLWTLLTISCDGDILICERDYNHEHVLGNLKTHTLHACWNSADMTRRRELHAAGRYHEIPLCRNCANSVQNA